jgi:LacI family transcriptional regulator
VAAHQPQNDRAQFHPRHHQTIIPPILRCVESVLEGLGYASIIVKTDNVMEREGRLLDVLRQRGVDGIVHAAVTHEDPLIYEVVAQGTPVVTGNRPGIPAFVNDEARGIPMLMEHLHAAGHCRIACIAWPEAHSTGQARLCPDGREAWHRCARLGDDPYRTVRRTRGDALQ